MKLYKKFISCCLSATMLISLSACDNKEEEVPVVDTKLLELQQSDYMGGVQRTYVLQDKVLNIIEEMKRNNTTIRSDNPNSFWNTSGYQDFVSSFLTTPIINDTQFFNEEKASWSSTVSRIYSVQNSFTTLSDEGYKKKYSSMAITRNEKDDYSITGLSGTLNNNSNYSGNMSYRILYDCDKDWCKAYTKVYIQNLGVNATSQMFEYARINDDVFAVQTTTERLIMVFETAENDMDIRNRTVKEFYYSKLSGGERTEFEAYELLPEYDENDNALKSNIKLNELMSNYSLLNREGECAVSYGINDSIFIRDDLYDLNHSWVFEDGALQQAIIYKEGTLVVTTYNKLSDNYERFIYSVAKPSDELIAETEKMVNIEGLVGIIEVTNNSSETIETVEPEQTTAVSDNVTTDTPITTSTNNNGTLTTSSIEGVEGDTTITSDTSASVTKQPQETTSSTDTTTLQPTTESTTTSNGG